MTMTIVKSWPRAWLNLETRDYFDTWYSTTWSYQLPQDRGGEKVTISDTGHGLDGPPHGLGDAGVLGVVHVLLREIREGPEYQHSHSNEQEQQTELLVAGLHGVCDCLQNIILKMKIRI